MGEKQGGESEETILHCWESTQAIAHAGKGPTSDVHSSRVQVPVSVPGGCWQYSQGGSGETGDMTSLGWLDSCSLATVVYSQLQLPGLWKALSIPATCSDALAD